MEIESSSKINYGKLIIISLVVVFLVILVIFIFFSLNKDEDSKENKKDNNLQSVENNNTDEYVSLKDITKKVKIVDRYDDFHLVFTESEFVKLYSISQMNPNDTGSFKVYTEDKSNFIIIRSEIQRLENKVLVENCEKESECSIIDNNENSIFLVEEDQFSKDYSYTIKIGSYSLVFKYSSSNSREILTQEIIYSLFKKCPETLSLDENVTSIFERATHLRLPFNKKVSKENIAEIFEDGIKIDGKPLKNNDWFTINIYYDLKENVTLEKVSDNPKVEKFEFVDGLSLKKSYFRLYEKGITYDIKAFYDGGYGGHDVDDYSELKQALDSIY